MTHLLLSHLSRDNNSPDLVMELFRPSAGKTEIAVASRDKETEIYYISRGETKEPLIGTLQPKNFQYSLFQ
jgi:hypothetical protein